MNLELHHFFILVMPGAEVAKLLSSIGIREGTGNIHEGQGTSNRRFNFLNGTLELLWVHDKEEALNGPGQGMFLYERASDKTASPFGIIVNRKDNISVELPFDGWKYEPVYFNPPWAFHVGANSTNLIEPLCVYMPFIEPGTPHGSKENAHMGPISNIKVYTPAKPVSEVLEAVNTADRVSIEHGNEHLMEITFDENKRRFSKDFRPDIPLIVHC